MTQNTQKKLKRAWPRTWLVDSIVQSSMTMQIGNRNDINRNYLPHHLNDNLVIYKYASRESHKLFHIIFHFIIQKLKLSLCAVDLMMKKFVSKFLKNWKLLNEYLLMKCEMFFQRKLFKNRHSNAQRNYHFTFHRFWFHLFRLFLLQTSVLFFFDSYIVSMKKWDS